MAEYASKGMSGTALGLGIAGTVGLLNSMGNSNNGNGFLGGILGGNNNYGNVNYVSQLQSKIQGLESEKYSDHSDKALYQQTLADNKSLRNDVFAFVTPLAQEAASNRERIAVLEAEHKCDQEKAALREQIMIGKINEVALTTNGRFNVLDQTIACISGKLDHVTTTVVPNSAVCPGWGKVCVEPIACPA